MRAVGLFSGIGGLELGLMRAGVHAVMLCENWPTAADVLNRTFPGVQVRGDIRQVRSIPRVDVVTAGFPCTDLSQVGRTRGIEGEESGLIREVFRLIERTPPTWLILENVSNMLTLHGGAPIRHLADWFDTHAWNWAYRTVDSQHFGVRQRRRRVLVVASRTEDPRTILFADETETEDRRAFRRHSAYGFYWTEGNRGVGWGEGVTPTLKGGSGWGIASPPGVWRPEAPTGQAIVRPSIEAGERLQGFRPGWTAGEREGIRWKLVGNAVTVPVAEWLGHRLVSPGDPVDRARPWGRGSRWPSAAAGIAGQRSRWDVSERPLAVRQRLTLDGLLRQYGSSPLSARATSGFASRLAQSSLRTSDAFRQSLAAHAAHMNAAGA